MNDDFSHHLVINGMVFVGFFSVSCVHHWLVHKRRPTAGESLKHAALSGIFTPAGLDAFREFVVHLVVYSGYIVPPH